MKECMEGLRRRRGLCEWPGDWYAYGADDGWRMEEMQEEEDDEDDNGR